MGVSRYRCAAVYAVVEDNVSFQLGCQVQHVRETVPDSLRRMDVAGDYQMVGEDGSAVDKDIVLTALSALERKGVLVLHVVLLAQRAPMVEDRKPSGV